MEIRRVETYANSRNWIIKIHKDTREAMCEIVLSLADDSNKRLLAVTLARSYAIEAWEKAYGPLDIGSAYEYVVHTTIQVLYYIREDEHSATR